MYICGVCSVILETQLAEYIPLSIGVAEADDLMHVVQVASHNLQGVVREGVRRDLGHDEVDRSSDFGENLDAEGARNRFLQQAAVHQYKRQGRRWRIKLSAVGIAEDVRHRGDLQKEREKLCHQGEVVGRHGGDLIEGRCC